MSKTQLTPLGVRHRMLVVDDVDVGTIGSAPATDVRYPSNIEFDVVVVVVGVCCICGYISFTLCTNCLEAVIVTGTVVGTTGDAIDADVW